MTVGFKEPIHAGWRINIAESDAHVKPHSGATMAGIIDPASTNNAYEGLETQKFEVPTCSFPVFRYWSWYSTTQVWTRGYAGAADDDVLDYTARYTTKFDGAGIDWTQSIIPLNRFAGMGMYERFSLATFSPEARWYIDDLSVGCLDEWKPLDQPEHFETDFGDWSVLGGLWYIGLENLFDGTHTGTNRVAGVRTNLAGKGYEPPSLYSPPFSIPVGCDSCTIQYRLNVVLKDKDYLLIGLVDCADIADESDLLDSYHDRFGDGGLANTDGWEDRRYEHSLGYVKDNGCLRLGFRLTQGQASSDSVFMVDDVRMTRGAAQ